MRTLHGSRCFKGDKSPRHHSVLTSISFLDVVAEHSSLFFPTSPILTNRLKIQTFSVYNIHGKKLQGKPLRARSLEWANPAPSTGYEPHASNFFSYTDTEHTPIHLPDSHHDFQCQNDASVISTSDPEGLPRSGASSSSKQTAAGRVPSMFGPSTLWKQMAGRVSGRTGFQETGAVSDRESVATTIFSSQSKGKRSRHKRCAFAERHRKFLPKKSLNGMLTWPSEER